MVSPSSRRPRGEAGFTLAELAITMVLAGILFAIGAAGYDKWQTRLEHQGSAQGLESFLRNAQQRAVSEARTFCVSFDADNRSYSLYRFSCDGSGELVAGPEQTKSAKVTIQEPSFMQSDGTEGSQVVFTPRGSATKGTVDVVRSGSDKVYEVRVEGLTARVSLAG